MINIQENKEKFISLLREKVIRPGADIEGLIQKMESSDFFTAPCSTKFHLAEDGGLCQHSLNVYEELKKLCSLHQYTHITEESITLVSLLHDMSKMDYYEKTIKPVKVYCEDGDKKDNGGRFRWENQESYKTIDAENRFVFGHHGQNSLFMVEYFIPLTIEEAAAINNHMGGCFDEYRPWDTTPIFNRFPLASLLHMADFMSTYLVENEQRFN